MSMTLKTTKNMWRGLSVVYKITTRRSTINVWKKSDLSRKKGLVRKIWDWPQPGQVLSRGWRCSCRRCSKYIWVINRLVAYLGASYIRGLTVSLACCSPAHGNGLTQLSLLTTTSQATAATITTPNNTGPPREQGSWGQHGAHLEPRGPRWAPCWPHELCYQGNNCHRQSWYRWHVELPAPGSAFADDWSGTKPRTT